MTPYDERQYRLMLERLQAYAEGKIGLDRLTDDIEGLLNALDSADQAWVDAATRAWAKLEDSRAAVRGGYQGDVAPIVQQGAETLTALVQSALKDIPTQ